MLVLSRRAEQQILFPHLGIRINVLQVKGQLVKLGVEAPRSVRVLRNELEHDLPAPQESPVPRADSETLTHSLRNELHLLNLKVQALQRRIERGDAVDAEAALRGLVDQFSAIDHSFDAPEAAPQAKEIGRPIRLLVVEDSDNERQLMAYLLASHGFDVQVATDGLVALEQLRAAHRLPDFVLMDMQMPFSDGLETLLQIRSSHRLQELKVYAVTGSERDTAREPIGRSWDGWFRKPLDVEALVTRLRKDVDLPLQPQVVR